MENMIWTCDVCGAEKGIANGWFLVEPNPWDFTVTAWEYGSALLDRDEKRDSVRGSLDHICGQECLHKRLSQWLETNSRTNPAT